MEDQMLVSYLIFLKTEETQLTKEERDDKILKAVNDYYVGKGL